MRYHLSPALTAALLALGSTACTIDVHGESVVTREEKRFTVAGRPELSLRTFDGSIRVQAWDQNEIRVEIERRGPSAQAAAALVVTATQSGDRVVVEAVSPQKDGGLHFGSMGSVSLIVSVPKTVTLEARSGDGSIAAEGLKGTLELSTGDGAIRVAGSDGAVKVHTGDGSIRIDDAVGSVEADTGDGAIELAGRLERLSVRTGDGSIHVTIQPGSALAEDWSVTTGDGAIDLRVPDALDADVEAHTGDGSIRADAVTPVGGGTRDRRTVRGRLGAGGRLLRVRSGDGSIVIAR